MLVVFVKLESGMLLGTVDGFGGGEGGTSLP